MSDQAARRQSKRPAADLSQSSDTAQSVTSRRRHLAQSKGTQHGRSARVSGPCTPRFERHAAGMTRKEVGGNYVLRPGRVGSARATASTRERELPATSSFSLMWSTCALIVVDARAQLVGNLTRSKMSRSRADSAMLRDTLAISVRASVSEVGLDAGEARSAPILADHGERESPIERQTLHRARVVPPRSPTP